MPLASCLVHISAGWVRDEAHEKWTLPEGYALGLGAKDSLGVVSMEDGLRG